MEKRIKEGEGQGWEETRRGRQEEEIEKAEEWRRIGRREKLREKRRNEVGEGLGKEGRENKRMKVENGE